MCKACIYQLRDCPCLCQQLFPCKETVCAWYHEGDGKHARPYAQPACELCTSLKRGGDSKGKVAGEVKFLLCHKVGIQD